MDRFKSGDVGPGNETDEGLRSGISPDGYRPGYWEWMLSSFGVAGLNTNAFTTMSGMLQRAQLKAGRQIRNFRRDSTVKDHPGYKILLTNDVPRKHRLNMMRRVERRNLLRSNGLLHRWKYLPRYLRTKNVATQRVAIDSLFVGGAS